MPKRLLFVYGFWFGLRESSPSRYATHHNITILYTVKVNEYRTIRRSDHPAIRFQVLNNELFVFSTAGGTQWLKRREIDTVSHHNITLYHTQQVDQRTCTASPHTIAHIPSNIKQENLPASRLNRARSHADGLCQHVGIAGTHHKSFQINLFTKSFLPTSTFYVATKANIRT